MQGPVPTESGGYFARQVSQVVRDALRPGGSCRALSARRAPGRERRRRQSRRAGKKIPAERRDHFSPQDERREHPTLVIPAKVSRENLTSPPRRFAPPLLKGGGDKCRSLCSWASCGDDEFAESGSEHRRQVRRRLRAAEEVALRFFAAFLLQEAQLRLGLDAFGDRFQAQVPGERDDGAHDYGAVGVAGDASHERLVHLEEVERKAVEVAQ